MVSPTLTTAASKEFASPDEETKDAQKKLGGSSEAVQTEVAAPSARSSDPPGLRQANSKEREAKTEAKGKAKARCGRVLEFVVAEDHEPEAVHLVLPRNVRRRWSLRLAEAASQAEAAGQAWKNSSKPPLRWYSSQLLSLCAGTATLSAKLMALQVQRTQRPWMWKDGGHLSRMLAQYSDMLAQAGSVVEATTAALGVPLLDTIRQTRKHCLPTKLFEPMVPTCFPCGAEEAMAVMQSALARLRGAGSALGSALRFSQELGASGGSSVWEEFFKLVPFLEMALSNLHGLVKLVMQQLDHDSQYVPANLGNDGPLADPSMKSLGDSPSFADAWASKELDLEAEEEHAIHDPDADDFRHSPSEDGLEGSASMKGSRKSVKRKTVTKKKGSK
mmetsp:Transcript_22058/g.41560  ORF Transcript_22058/g.41560 Transcript_22058/m.41560 type:complete len:389 (+) Transcript_22058:28-1194(+)